VRSFDTVIFGGGVAGFAAAIALTRQGQRVAAIERETGPRPLLGETLSAAAGPFLAKLGVWDRFLADGHAPCHAVKSAWGSPAIGTYDFLSTPHGHSWRVDRPAFERGLSEMAAALGISRIARRRPATVCRVRGAWHIVLPDGETVAAGFLIDATGRAAVLARRRGARRLAFDRQIAVVGLFATPASSHSDTSLLVESTADGWWYSATLPDGRVAAALLTDSDLHPPITLRAEHRWIEMLATTRHIHTRIVGGIGRLASPLQIMAAGSSRLDRATGDAWLAVGDAAMTYDPLSGHGLVAALASARNAATAIEAHRDGDFDALTAYDSNLAQAFAAYDAGRRASYAAEQRWPAAPYWRRRRRSGP
jgi:flavin-dependent dehydrogenase